MAENAPVFVDLKECCRRTGLSVWYLRRGCVSGELPHIRSGKKILLNLPALLQTLDAKSRQGGG